MSAPQKGCHQQRLDWRHLLPSPDRAGRLTAMVLGLSGDVADALVEAGVVVEVVNVVDGPPRGRRADLLVVGSQLGTGELRGAMRSLSAGGILYLERSRTSDLRRSAWAARRAVHSAGLTELGRWVALPDLIEPRRYLPLDHSGALRWYFRCNFVAGSLTSAATRMALLAATTIPHLVEHAMPNTVLVAVRGPRPHPEAIPGVGALTAPHRAVITSGHDLASRSIILPFAPRSAWPAVAVKVATRPAFGATTLDEHERLKELWAVLPPQVASALPVPLAIFELSGLAAATQATARGPTLWARSGRWPHRPRLAIDDLDLVTGWLVSFAKATEKPGPPDPAAAWLEQPLNDLKAISPVSDTLERLVAAAARELRERCGGGLASVAQHYDTGPWNIVRSERGLCILDWELDRQVGRDGFGPPLVDLLYFVGSWHSLASGTSESDGQVRDLVELFSDDAGERWQTTQALGALGRYADELGVPRSATWALLVALWLERALTSLRRWQRMGAGTAPDDTPLRYLEAMANRAGKPHPRAR